MSAIPSNGHAERLDKLETFKESVLRQLQELTEAIQHSNDIGRANGAALELVLKAMGLDEKREAAEDNADAEARRG